MEKNIKLECLDFVAEQNKLNKKFMEDVKNALSCFKDKRFKTDGDKASVIVSPIDYEPQSVKVDEVYMDEYGYLHLIDTDGVDWDESSDIFIEISDLYVFFSAMERALNDHTILYDTISQVLTWYEHPEEYPFGEEDFNRHISRRSVFALSRTVRAAAWNLFHSALQSFCRNCHADSHTRGSQDQHT